MTPDAFKLIYDGKGMMDTEVFGSYYVAGQTVVHLVLVLKGGGIIKSIVKDKVGKKELMKAHATKSFAEVDKQTYQAIVFQDIQKFLRTLSKVDEKQCGEVFRQAVENMNEEDVDSALWAFNSKNRKMNTTEERAKHFLTLATKARLTHLDAHIEEAMKLKEAVMSKMMVLFGEFCGTDSNRYKNAL